MLIIGLTGGIGSGKSAAGTRFEALGIPVIDADQVGRDLCEPGEEGYEQIVKSVGEDILDKDKRIDRKRLRERVFTNSRLRKQLEQILHPMIREEMRQRANQFDAPYCIFMIPLLVESGQHKTVDRVLVVDASEEQQLSRAQLRDNSTRAQVEVIMGAQADRKTRLSFADDVIHNIGDLDALYSAVDRLDKKYRQLAQQKCAPQPATSENGSSKKSSKPVISTQSIELPAWLTQFIKSDMSGTEANSVNVFELPLQERLRTFLRLESLFAEFRHYLQEDCIWSSRNAIRILLAIQQVFQHRPDTKTEMIKECDRIYALFGRYTNNEHINVDKLLRVREELKQTATALRALSGKPGELLRKNDLITQLKQKENVPGGPNILDLPCFAHWLNLPHATKVDDLETWFQEFVPLKNGVELLLTILRESAVTQKHTANKGFFQASLEAGITYHLIRVELEEGENYCAEISGGQHRFTIHFLQPSGTSRPTPVKKDVSFLLSCCAL